MEQVAEIRYVDGEWEIHVDGDLHLMPEQVRADEKAVAVLAEALASRTIRDG